MCTATQWRRQLIGVWLTVLGLAPACQKEAPYPEPRATPPARFTSAQVLTIELDSIRAYDKTLEYDAELGAADERRVDFERGLFGRGGRARIQPEIGSYRIEEEELAQGRVIARIWSDSVAPSWGFGPWWTWWWVDKNGPENTWRSVFIADSRTPGYRVVRKDAMVLERHPDHYRWRQALASFREGTVVPWGTCGSKCCKQQ